MEKLGQWLKATREAKGISLLEVERATRVRSKFLAALEADDFELLPPRSYLKGMVRVYASFLSLDVDQALRMLEAELGPENSYDIREVATPIQRRTMVTAKMITVLVVLAVVATAVVYLLPKYEKLAASLQDTDLSTLAPSNLPSLSGASLTSPAPGPARADAAPAETPTQTPTPAPTATPTPLQEITVEVKITDRTWLAVDVDGRTVLQQIMLPGATQSWTAKDQIKMRAGNAGGVEITFNGKRQGLMGAKGEVVDRTWTRP